jgi:hypothetical protein
MVAIVDEYDVALSLKEHCDKRWELQITVFEMFLFLEHLRGKRWGFGNEGYITDFILKDNRSTRVSIKNLAIRLRIWLMENEYFPALGPLFDKSKSEVPLKVARSKIFRTNQIIRPVDSAAARVSDYDKFYEEHK